MTYDQKKKAIYLSLAALACVGFIAMRQDHLLKEEIYEQKVVNTLHDDNTMTSVQTGYAGGDLVYVFDFSAQSYTRTYKGQTVTLTFQESNDQNILLNQSIYHTACETARKSKNSRLESRYCP